jgi:hypothetical protein
MKHSTLNRLLFSIICYISISTAYAADTFAVTESQTDSLTSFKEDGSTYYSQNTSGKFSVAAKIAGTSFDTAGIDLAAITADSTIAISIGSYSFSSTFSAADKTPTLPSAKGKIAAIWTEYHDGTTCKTKVADIAECPEFKQVKHNTVSISGTSKTITLKIDGTSNIENAYGSTVFADTCKTAADGVTTTTATENADATLTIDETPLTVSLQISCKVTSKTKTPVKDGDSYNLVTATVKAKKI